MWSENTIWAPYHLACPHGGVETPRCVVSMEIAGVDQQADEWYEQEDLQDDVFIAS